MWKQASTNRAPLPVLTGVSTASTKGIADDTFLLQWWMVGSETMRGWRMGFRTFLVFVIQFLLIFLLRDR